MINTTENTLYQIMQFVQEQHDLIQSIFGRIRWEEHTYELQSPDRISYAVC